MPHACTHPHVMWPCLPAPGSICKYVCGVLKDKLLGSGKEGKAKKKTDWDWGLGKEPPPVSFLVGSSPTPEKGHNPLPQAALLFPL